MESPKALIKSTLDVFTHEYMGVSCPCLYQMTRPIRSSGRAGVTSHGNSTVPPVGACRDSMLADNKINAIRCQFVKKST